MTHNQATFALTAAGQVSFIHNSKDDPDLKLYFLRRLSSALQFPLVVLADFLPFPAFNILLV